MFKRIEMGMLSIKAKHDAVGRYKPGIGVHRASSDQERRAGCRARLEIFSMNQAGTRPPITLYVDICVSRACRANTDDGGSSIETDRYMTITRQGDRCQRGKVCEV